MDATQGLQTIKTINYGLVSIIMPTYKQCELMHKAVQSVLNQSYKNIELIVIDDNREESYREANKRYFDELNDSRIIYLQNEINLGSARTRNKGIELSKGDYITFLDDDDYYTEYKVEKQVEAMHNENAEASICNLILFNEDGKVTDKRRRRYLKRNEPILTAHLKYHITGTDTMMYKADFIKEIGGFDTEDLGDEFYLMYKAVSKSPKFLHVDYDGAFAIVHNQAGLSSGDNKIKAEKMLMEFKRTHFDSLKRKDIRYIKMRHNMVLAMAHKKNRSYFKCLGHLIKAVLICPFGMLKILTGKDR